MKRPGFSVIEGKPIRKRNRGCRGQHLSLVQKVELKVSDREKLMLKAPK